MNVVRKPVDQKNQVQVKRGGKEILSAQDVTLFKPKT
jgi:hypothetical protein